MTISVVMPTLNEEVSLPATLAQFEHLPGRWEVFVVDSGSSDRTLAIATEAGASIVAEAPLGRGAAMNAGAARASGAILLFLHADTLLPVDAYGLLVTRLRRPDVAATAFRLRVDREGWRYRLLTPIATLRFRVQRTFFGDQAIAVRRRDFERAGGYREPRLMEDVELSQRLREHGRLELLPAAVTTSARRFEQGGVFRTLVRMSLLQVAYGLGVPTDRLGGWYQHVRANQPNGPSERERIDLRQLDLRDETDRTFELDTSLGRGPVLLVFLRWLG